MEQKIYYNKIGIEKIEDLTRTYNPKVNYTELLARYLELKQQEVNQ